MYYFFCISHRRRVGGRRGQVGSLFFVCCWKACVLLEGFLFFDMAPPCTALHSRRFLHAFRDGGFPPPIPEGVLTCVSYGVVLASHEGFEAVNVLFYYWKRLSSGGHFFSFCLRFFFFWRSISMLFCFKTGRFSSGRLPANFLFCFDVMMFPGCHLLFYA